MLSAPPGKLGYWDAGFGSLTGKNPPNPPTNLDTSEVPFLAWSKALYEARRAEQDKIGHWEGDALVIDTVGFNEKFWMVRAGFPHTDGLHLIERISRPDYNTLKYEATIDDLKTYTRPWTGGWTIPWHDGEDFPEYFCQDNNRNVDHLVGQ